MLADPDTLRRQVFSQSEAPASVLSAVQITMHGHHLMVFAEGEEGVSVYRWSGAVGTFRLVQVLHEPNAVDVQHSVLRQNAAAPPIDLLIVVNGVSSSYAPSAVYRWNSTHFVRSSVLDIAQDLNGNMRYASAASAFSVSDKKHP
jgi:hypothetical protein